LENDMKGLIRCTALVGLLIVGCASMPREGIVGVAYSSETETLTTKFCPLGEELRMSIDDAECVPLAEPTPE
jgi:hypothetical protein